MINFLLSNFNHYYKMWVQFISPCVKHHWIHSGFPLDLVQWDQWNHFKSSHSMNKDSFYCNVKNMILTWTKDFSWEKKKTQIHQILNLIDFKFSESYDNFQKVAKNIEGFCVIFFFPSFIPIYVTKFWLNYFLDEHHFGLHQKNLEKKPWLAISTKDKHSFDTH